MHLNLPDSTSCMYCCFLSGYAVIRSVVINLVTIIHKAIFCQTFNLFCILPIEQTTLHPISLFFGWSTTLIRNRPSWNC